MWNDRQFYNYYEIIGGRKIMAPSAPLYHGNFIVEVAFAFKYYFRQNQNGYVFFHGAEVQFSQENIFQPDVVVISRENERIIDWKSNIKGAPDMVVEVLSKSTRNNDLTTKKDTYEKFGVKEYWIVDPLMEIIDVYILRDGKYEFDNEYVYYDDEEFAELEENEKAKVKFEISPSIFPDLKIKLANIFTWRKI